MVRKTKEKSSVRRNKLPSATGYPLQEQGVSQTWLQDFAQRAPTTRGVICQHFKDKARLFYAQHENTARIRGGDANNGTCRAIAQSEEATDRREKCFLRDLHDALQLPRSTTFCTANYRQRRRRAAFMP